MDFLVLQVVPGLCEALEGEAGADHDEEEGHAEVGGVFAEGAVDGV